MAIPDHADKRAHRFYYSGFVGSGHGDNGSSRSTSWDSMHEDLKQTAVVTHLNGNPMCAYCGNRALPIQDPDTYHVHGHTCCCKDTMDELEWRVSYSNLLAEQLAARKELEKAAPVINKAVLQRLMDYSHQATVKRLGETIPDVRSLTPYGIDFITPLDHFNRR